MIKVLKAGFYTTIQDLGRFGYRDKGVPVSGAMDTYSSSLANALLDNDQNAAVLEMTMLGPKLKFMTDTEIAISGAYMHPSLNDTPLSNNRKYRVKMGDVLNFKGVSDGFRTYLAVKDGIQSPVVLNSRSMYVPITTFAQLKEDTTIPVNTASGHVTEYAHIKTDEEWYSGNDIEVFKGPEYDLFPDIKKRLRNDYTVSKVNNRMAYQVEEVFITHERSMLTSATIPGTVQLTPAGKLIILMKDAQTTGGYPRVFQLTEKAIAKLAQKKAGENIRFELLT
ncbi:biotin-dependent carboxylase uncharacterized domain-containing protein [Zhouia amylolytica]|uniref:Biotin-dependent carboxylase uncharacterized domain-containing protein n=1 Tax=Zhouia amylolytica TaxID=376730 RepID=A0A1I6QVM9_9FLAO|nr:biotin-dependent carboxyltransferase family protein [Zhouia amylolytica]SFS56587.1 biotin-dependent carboxylase uncharacterized domain-containing protein [Zhouia amylolytica]